MLVHFFNQMNIINIIDTDFGKRVFFANGYSLSIVQGCGRNSHNNFEVAVISPENELDYTYTNGDTLNYQTPVMIIGLAKKIAGLDAKLELKSKNLRLKQIAYFEKIKINDSSVFNNLVPCV